MFECIICRSRGTPLMSYLRTGSTFCVANASPMPITAFGAWIVNLLARWPLSAQHFWACFPACGQRFKEADGDFKRLFAVCMSFT